MSIPPPDPITDVTIETMAAWLPVQVRSEQINQLLQRALDATLEVVTERLGDWVAVPWPANVNHAVLMQATRLYKRHSTPEGVAGFGDLGVVRITALDPDVENMLNPDLAWWVA